MCNSPASDFGWREPGLLHTAVLEKWAKIAHHFNFLNGTRCSLTPGRRYYYVYGDYYGWSSEKSFKAAPSSKMDVKSTVIAFGGQSVWCHVITTTNLPCSIVNCVHLPFSTFNDLCRHGLWWGGQKLLCAQQHTAGVLQHNTHDPTADGPWKCGLCPSPWRPELCQRIQCCGEKRLSCAWNFESVASCIFFLHRPCSGISSSTRLSQLPPEYPTWLLWEILRETRLPCRSGKCSKKPLCILKS